jgi:hypothetical protein
MKTTVEIPDELLIAAKRKAADSRTTLRELLERGLRKALAEPSHPRRKSRQPAIRWVTAKGGLPQGLNVRDREEMHEWLRQQT